MDAEPAGPMKGRILLHICCAPCGTSPMERLAADGWEVTGYFYNPNIYPREEYECRVEEIRRYCGKTGIPLIVDTYDCRRWEENAAPFANEGEGSARCNLCFLFRLERVAQFASENGYDAFTTTLTISPHKDAETIFKIGAGLEERTGVEFAHYNFKKKNGFIRSIKISKEHGLYRQDYCGCRYSLMEKENRRKRPIKVD